MTDRPRRLAERLEREEVDVLLISNLVNLRYLTGYTGTNGIALVGPRTRTFLTDFRYVQQASEEVHPSFQRGQASLDLLDAVQDALPDGPVRLGFEAESVSVARHARLRGMLHSRVQLVGTMGLVEGLRAIKEPGEVAAIRAATELADQAFTDTVERGLLGRTEREVATALELRMRELGARRASFETIVAAGGHAALPHAQPRDVEIGPGDVVVIDWGAEVDGYCSDSTRTLAAGDWGERERELYQLVLNAQITGLGALEEGAEGRVVDATAREVIEAAGYGERFGHGLGHGVGIEVHEAPRLSRRTEDVLRAGNVVTVEPGVYLPEDLGIRIEDLVVVTESGPEVLTSFTKEPIAAA